MFRYEHRRQRPIPLPHFLLRLLKSVGLSAGLIGVALFAGVYGYHTLEGLSWTDAFLNASMILGGMGPVGELHSDAAKVFASIYALFSGVVFIGLAGVLLAPLMHRLMHRFHLPEK